MPLPALSLSSTVEAQLFAWARTAAPREACGLLIGDGTGRHVTRAIELLNLAPDTRRFDCDPVGFVLAADAARAAGEEVLGVWHSHPRGPAAPSRADREGALRGERVWSQVIVSLADGEWRGYRLRGGELVEEPAGPAARESMVR